MTLYDKLTDESKEKINNLKANYSSRNLLKHLKETEYLSELKYYEITSLWWVFHPTSNMIDMIKLDNLFKN